MSLENQCKDIFKLRDFATHSLAYNSRRIFIFEDCDFTTVAIIAPTLEICMMVFDKKNKIETRHKSLDFKMRVNTLIVSVYATSDADKFYEILQSLSEKWRGKRPIVCDTDGYHMLVPGKYYIRDKKRDIKRRMQNMARGMAPVKTTSTADWEINCYTEDDESDMAQSIIAALALEDEKISVSWTQHALMIAGRDNGRIYATREEFKIFDITENLITEVAPNHSSYHGTWLARLIFMITDISSSARPQNAFDPVWDPDY